jgi:uroporphyrinogen decarboxylase
MTRRFDMTDGGKLQDGVHGLVPRERQSIGARRLRDFFGRVPNAPIVQAEFGYYSLDRWTDEGHIDAKTDLSQLFGFDEPGEITLDQLGWCEASLSPVFETKVLEDRGEHELVQDYAGRHVLFFKGRRNGFMPEYVDHPVKDRKTWEDQILWRLDPKTPERFANLDARMANAKEAAAKGMVVTQNLIGGYMYLRSLIGPVDLLYKFHDDPDLIHSCMETWLALADTVVARHQEHVTLDQMYFGEDICYNHGPLISPDMISEFLLPYYQQLVTNSRARQIDKTRHMIVQIDTDGFSDPIIPVYQKIGMDYLSPFEVASGCDVVRTASQYPELLIRGGFDKRIIAAGKAAIDREVDRILPVMKRRGGFIPMCDHGVPEEVAFEDYVHFRKRLREYA